MARYSASPSFIFYRQGGQKGVAPSLVCLAAMGILTSWWYARKIKIERVVLTLRQVREETSALLKLGVVFMTSGLMTLGAAYLVNVILLRKFGLAGAGFYSSAWTWVVTMSGLLSRRWERTFIRA